MTNKTYTFITIKEIAEQLSLEQIDNFLIDFGQWLKFIKTGKSNSPEFDKFAGEIKDLIKTLGKLTGEALPENFIDTSKFKWLDDGLHEPKKLTIIGGDQNIEFTMPKKKKA